MSNTIIDVILSRLLDHIQSITDDYHVRITFESFIVILSKIHFAIYTKFPLISLRCEIPCKYAFAYKGGDKNCNIVLRSNEYNVK